MPGGPHLRPKDRRGQRYANARRPQSPACGYPARRRSSTQDFAGRATRDGRRDLRALA